MLDQGWFNYLDSFELQSYLAQTRCSTKVGLIIFTVLNFNQTRLKLDFDQVWFNYLDSFELPSNLAQTRCLTKVGSIILTVFSFNQTWLKLDV